MTPRSEAQLTANRENAQLSTGPTTEAGKAKSCFNAIKSGLTGRTILLPAEDAAQYQSDLQAYEDHFKPVGPEERALVQSLADIRWRLNRIPGLEMGIYAKGHIEFAGQFEDCGESLRPGLIELQTFLTYEKQLRNLHLQEARLVRRREKETAELRRLQQERLEKETREREAAAQSGEPPETSQFGFEFSTPETQVRPAAAQSAPTAPRRQAA